MYLNLPWLKLIIKHIDNHDCYMMQDFFQNYALYSIPFFEKKNGIETFVESGETVYSVKGVVCEFDAC